MATEEEEFEFRARAEAEAGAVSAKPTPREMSKTGYWDMALSGPLGLVSNLTGGMQGIRDVNKAIEEGAYEAGGRVADVATGAGASPEVAGGAGYATNVALNAIPALAGGGAAGKLAEKAVGVPLRDVGKWFMKNALSPTYEAKKSGDAAVAVDTLLERGLNVTEGGLDKLRSAVSDLNAQIDQAVSRTRRTVSKPQVGVEMQKLYDEFLKKAYESKDMNAIKKAWMEFRNHPLLRGKTDIPARMAQEAKKGKYEQLEGKYGEMGKAETEAQKTIARALKEGIERAVPRVAPMNAEEARLLRTIPIAERATIRGSSVTPGVVGDIGRMIEYLTYKNPLINSLIARGLYRGAVPLSEISGAAAGSGQLPELYRRLSEDE